MQSNQADLVRFIREKTGLADKMRPPEWSRFLAGTVTSVLSNAVAGEVRGVVAEPAVANVVLS
jgi:hypothetical protein